MQAEWEREYQVFDTNISSFFTFRVLQSMFTYDCSNGEEC